MNKNILPESLQTHALEIPEENLHLLDGVHANTFGDLHHARLFTTYYGVIPNVIEQSKVNCKTALKWFTNSHSERINDVLYNKKCMDKTNLPVYDDVHFFLEEDLMVSFNTNFEYVRCHFKKTPLAIVEVIIEGLRAFIIDESESEISLLSQNEQGIKLQRLSLNTTRFDIHDNYNDDFKQTHEIILKRLMQENDKGIVLLHGLPGTGKTSYIRYLVSEIKKKIIFVPPKMTQLLTSPELIPILIENPNSILIIEDAEQLVIDRNQNGNSPVSTILNISDGLLSDCLNIQVICTFNTDLSKVDSALLRKGRLIAKYNFEKLSPEKATALSKALGHNNEFTSAATLTDVFNQDEKTYKIDTKTIGFSRAS